MQVNSEDIKNVKLSKIDFAAKPATKDLEVKKQESVYRIKKALLINKSKSSEVKKSNEYVVSYFLDTDEAPPAKSITVHDFKKLKSHETLSFLWLNSKAFLRYTKMQAEIVEMEVETTREIKAQKKRWLQLKEAFQKKLELLNIKAQNKLE